MDIKSYIRPTIGVVAFVLGGLLAKRSAQKSLDDLIEEVVPE